MMFPGIYGIYRIHVVSCGKEKITIPMYHHDIPIFTSLHGSNLKAVQLRRQLSRPTARP